MIHFRQRTMWESLMRLWPPHRRREDARMLAALQLLCRRPDLPCMVEGRLVPNGWGQPLADNSDGWSQP